MCFLLREEQHDTKSSRFQLVIPPKHKPLANKDFVYTKFPQMAKLPLETLIPIGPMRVNGAFFFLSLLLLERKLGFGLYWETRPFRQEGTIVQRPAAAWSDSRLVRRLGSGGAHGGKVWEVRDRDGPVPRSWEISSALPAPARFLGSHIGQCPVGREGPPPPAFSHILRSLPHS